MLNALEELSVSTENLVVHVIGADFREGTSFEQTKHVFHHFFQQIPKTIDQCSTVQLALIGPNVPGALHRCSRRYDDDKVAQQIEYFVGVWEEYASSPTFRPADCSFCFNAGIWGYDAWLPSIQHLVVECSQPVVITSYNELEAMDDYETLLSSSQHQQLFAWAWKPVANPNASATIRPSRSIPGRFLAENAYWQCLVPLGEREREKTTGLKE